MNGSDNLRDDARMKQWTRRKFLAQAGAAATGTVFSNSQLLAGMIDDMARIHAPVIIARNTGRDGRRRSGRGKHKKVIVLGVDGMDPRLCSELMNAKELPALAKMCKSGSFRPLGTSIPPQSPVAWANFITGAGPGAHGIFDFIHRNPTGQYAPYYSAAETVKSEEGWEIGGHRLVTEVKYRDKSGFPNPFTVMRDALIYKRRTGNPKTIIMFDADVFEQHIAPLLKENYNVISNDGEGNQS